MAHCPVLENRKNYNIVMAIQGGLMMQTDWFMRLMNCKISKLLAVEDIMKIDSKKYASPIFQNQSSSNIARKS